MKTALTWSRRRNQCQTPAVDSLSFAALEKRICDMPAGPASVLDAPSWTARFNMLGTAGIIVGVAPSIAIQFFRPSLWMVSVTKLGLWMTVVGFVPIILRTTWLIALQFWRWRSNLVEQSDHDVGQFRQLRQWLRKFPRADLEEHHRFAALAQRRLGSKLGVLQGGFDKLGVLPALLALVVLLSKGNPSIEALLNIPIWQSLPALMFAITYMIGFMVVLMWLRLQLYETVLADALEHSESTRKS